MPDLFLRKKRRNLAVLHLVAFFIGATSLYSEVSSQNDVKPHKNVIVILADDLGWNDISLHGGKSPTPNIDKLAKEGVELKNLVVNSICSPTRAAFLTGMNAVRNGFGAEVGDRLKREFKTIANTFKDDGYRTAIFGKWHNGKPNLKTPHSATPPQVGFEKFIGFYGGGTDFFSQNDKVGEPGSRNWYLNEELNHGEEGYTTDLITDAAIDFIKENSGGPFFCYVAQAAPHDPFQATDALLKRVPPEIRNRIELTEEMVKTKSRNPNKKTDFKTWEFGGFTEEERLMVYSAMIIGLDDSVGRIIKQLQDLNIDKNTIVLFFSDNGAMRFIREGNLPFKGWKHELYEGGTHVPAFLVAPGQIPSGSQFTPLIRAEDLYPTLTSMAGVKMPAQLPLDGVNMAIALKGEAEAPDVEWNSIFVNYGAHRSGNWKLIVRSSENELYNLKDDPGESKDVSAAHPEIFHQLLEKHQTWLKEMGANVNYSPAVQSSETTEPSKQVLEFTVPKGVNNSKIIVELPNPGPIDLEQIGASGHLLEAEPGDRLVYDMCIINYILGTKAFVSTTRLGAITFNDKNGIDSKGKMLAAKMDAPEESGLWSRRTVGIGNLAAMRHGPLRIILEVPQNREQDFCVLFDNIHVLKPDGRKIPYLLPGKLPTCDEPRVKIVFQNS